MREHSSDTHLIIVDFIDRRMLFHELFKSFDEFSIVFAHSCWSLGTASKDTNESSS